MGNVMAKLTVNQQNVQQWSVLVLPGKPYTPNTVVETLDGPTPAGDKALLRLQLKDLFGNVIPSSNKADFNGTQIVGPVTITAVSGEIRYGKKRLHTLIMQAC